MVTDIQKTQHFTTNSQHIIGNLIKYIPEDAKIIEPFVGAGDLLLPELKGRDILTYDIEPVLSGTIQCDTLNTSPNYTGRWVITNPPYLAKNKADDKRLFEKYAYDDLYKIALSTMLEAEGGIVVIPTNFFVDERTYKIRKLFLDKFQVLYLNIFNNQVFESTTYNVCSFAFKKLEEPLNVQTVPIHIFPENEEFEVSLNKNSNYQIGGEYFRSLTKYKSIFNRLQQGKDVQGYETNLYLTTIDTREEHFKLVYNEEHYYGKVSDRVRATLSCKYKLSNEQELLLIEEFNKEIERFRKENHNLVFGIYRDNNRKKISFTVAYKLLTKIYIENFSKGE